MSDQEKESSESETEAIIQEIQEALDQMDPSEYDDVEEDVEDFQEVQEEEADHVEEESDDRELQLLFSQAGPVADEESQGLLELEEEELAPQSRNKIISFARGDDEDLLISTIVEPIHSLDDQFSTFFSEAEVNQEDVHEESERDARLSHLVEEISTLRHSFDEEVEEFHVNDEKNKDCNFSLDYSAQIRFSTPKALREIMTIPEEEAEEALDRMAHMENVKDPLVLYDDDEQHAESPILDSYVPTSQPRMYRCPLIESCLKPCWPALGVDLYLLPGKRMISHEASLHSTIWDLKVAVGRYCKQCPDQLKIRHRQFVIADWKTLDDIGGKPGKRLKFQVELKYDHGEEELHILETGLVAPKVPDVLRKSTFYVRRGSEEDDGPMEKVQREVRIKYDLEVKPLLGGFINKRSDLTFHHATTQTLTKKELLAIVDPGRKHDVLETHNASQRVDKACQPFREWNKCTQTLNDKSTQSERKDYYPSVLRDRIFYAKCYKSYDDILKEKTKAAIIIQKYWRRVLAKRVLAREMRRFIGRIAFVEKVRKVRLQQRLKMMEEEYFRLLCPSRMTDFELLYREITKWKEEQQEYLAQNRWGAELKAGLALVTEMESDLLLALERSKKRMLDNRKEKWMGKQLEKMGAPRRWFSSKATAFLSFDSQSKAKARKLHITYLALTKPVPDTEEGIKERLRLINDVHNLLREEMTRREGKIPVVEMLLELFTREIKLMANRHGHSLVEGVRKRTAHLFFSFCKDPIFNEEAKDLDQTPWEFTKLKQMAQCKGCRRMLDKDNFVIVKGCTLSGRCQTCEQLYRTSIVRVDLQIYRQMLLELRRDEFSGGVQNSSAFLIDAYDMRTLVEVVWLGQSALSGIADRYFLRLCRWDKAFAWTPWNCILLTEEEAIAHLSLEDMNALQNAYTPHLFHKVKVKHFTARVHFKCLAKISIDLDERVAEKCKEMEKEARDIKQIKHSIHSPLNSQ